MLSKLTPLLFAALVAVVTPVAMPVAAMAQGRPTAHYDPVGNPMLPFDQIKARGDRAVPGGRLIGSDYDEQNFVYQLRYERGRDIIDILIDARTGRVVGGREKM